MLISTQISWYFIILHSILYKANKRTVYRTMFRICYPSDCKSHGVLFFVQLHLCLFCTCVTEIASRDSSGRYRDKGVIQWGKVSFMLAHVLVKWHVQELFVTKKIWILTKICFTAQTRWAVPMLIFDLLSKINKKWDKLNRLAMIITGASVICA